MTLEHIIFTTEAGIARVTVNRPEVRNALNRAVRLELREVIETINADKSIRVVIITGAGDRAFIAGADVTLFKEADPIEIEEFTRTIGQQLYTRIESMDVPVIAMINGFCLGGGCEIAMACDIRIASENARLGQPEINLGFIPGGGATQRLPRLVGWGRAKELIYTGRIIDAAEAEKIGLVDKVVPHDKLEETVNQIAENIASKSSIIVKLAKKAVNRGMYTDLSTGLDYEKAYFALCFATSDQKEGVSAFLEKRQPEFKGE